jgi:gluconolactonase
VKLPVKKPTACTFGGADLGELFVTTRVEKGDGASEHWGAVLSVRVPGVKGAAGAYAANL